jgi:hypothetical protein
VISDETMTIQDGIFPNVPAKFWRTTTMGSLVERRSFRVTGKLRRVSNLKLFV